MNTKEKYATLQKIKACSNCLRFGHSSKQCSNSGKCRRCERSHNTLLHDDNFKRINFQSNENISYSGIGNTDNKRCRGISGEAE